MASHSLSATDCRVAFTLSMRMPSVKSRPSPPIPLLRLKNRKSFVGKMASLFIGLLVICMVLSCVMGAVRSTGQAVGIEATNTPSPLPTATNTRVPTNMPAPTDTPAPTNTPSPTDTPTKPPTPTATLTEKEQKAAATATIVALEEQYEEVDIRDLAKGPNRYKGKKIRLRGIVFNITEDTHLFGGTYTFMQIWVQVPGGSEFDREAVAVNFDGTLEGVYDDSEVIVYGTGNGTMNGTNAMGASISQPMIEADTVRY